MSEMKERREKWQEGEPRREKKKKNPHLLHYFTQDTYLLLNQEVWLRSLFVLTSFQKTNKSKKPIL